MTFLEEKAPKTTPKNIGVIKNSPLNKRYLIHGADVILLSLQKCGNY